MRSQVDDLLTILKRFLNFFPLHGKTAAGITQASLDELKQNDLDVMMCRGGGGARVVPGGALPPQNFSGLFLKVLHRPLTAPLVAKLAPPVAPPNENVWLRPCVGAKDMCLLQCQEFMQACNAEVKISI